MAGTDVIKKKLTDEEVINMLKRGPLNTKQIAQRTGRSTPSIYKILGILYDKGIIEHNVDHDEVSGRKSAYWSIKK